jgi:hypothetical protein
MLDRIDFAPLFGSTSAPNQRETIEPAQGSGLARASQPRARAIWAGAQMASAEDYRRKAEDFRKQATSVPPGDLRQAYLEIADEYDRLATAVERLEQRDRGRPS